MSEISPLEATLTDYAADMQGFAIDYGPRATDLPSAGTWATAKDISIALCRNKKAVQRMAARDAWPTRQCGGQRLEYRVPAEIAAILVPDPSGRSDRSAPRVRFADLIHDQAARELVLLRQQACMVLTSTMQQQGKEQALALTAKHFTLTHPAMPISVRSLRRWHAAYVLLGIDGLVEQKRGHSGRKSIASQLASEDILRTTAAAVEYGAPRKGTASGRLNMARAYRDLVANPTVAGPVRARLHGDYASKSKVPDSMRAAIHQHAAPLTQTLVQIGPKAAKLDGPHIECNYDNLPVYSAITADDMTCNFYCWVEWPNERGWLLIRPQLLAVMDIASLCWLNLRLIIRPKGQYNRDDVWGTIGDTLDQYGLFDTAVLEGGTWQSELLIGQRTNIDDGTRFGGLKSLGIKVIHTRTPRGKIIEGEFNTLQSALDRVPGYCGRDERKDCPEITKQHLRECESGKAHPRQYFLSLAEARDQVLATTCALNNERKDGKLHHGLSPWDKWSAERPSERPMPDAAKWMYRSTFTICKVTANGVRVTQGTGRHQVAYTYSDDALGTWRGQRVICYWNDSNPDTAACVYSIRDAKPHTLIAVASRIKELPRFGASDEQLAAEKRRVAMAHNLAVSQSASLAPYLERQSAKCKVNNADQENSTLCTINSALPNVAQDIRHARQAAETRESKQREIKRAVHRAELTPDDERAVLGDLTQADPSRIQPNFSEEEINSLLSSE